MSELLLGSWYRERMIVLSGARKRNTASVQGLFQTISARTGGLSTSLRHHTQASNVVSIIFEVT